MAFSDYVIVDLCFLIVLYVTTHDCQIILHTNFSPVPIDGRHFVGSNASSPPAVANYSDVTSSFDIAGSLWTTTNDSISGTNTTSGPTGTTATPITTTTFVPDNSANKSSIKSDVVTIATVAIDGLPSETTRPTATSHLNSTTSTPSSNTTDVFSLPSTEQTHHTTSASTPLPSTSPTYQLGLNSSLHGNRRPISTPSQTRNYLIDHDFRSVGRNLGRSSSSTPGGRRTGRLRNRPHHAAPSQAAAPAPSNRHQTPVPPVAVKWAQRNEIAARQHKHNLYLFGAPSFGSATLTTSATRKTTSDSTGNGTNNTEARRSTSGQRYQQLVLGAGIICSLASGGALIALIGVTVAKCRSALSTWGRSESVAELGHGGTSPETGETTRRSVGIITSSSDENSGVYVYFRQRIRDHWLRLTMGLGTRLLGGRFISPEGERKRGDGVESFPATNDSTQAGKNKGLNEMSDSSSAYETAVGVLTFTTSSGVNMGSPLLPSAPCVHVPPPPRPRLYQTKRCPQPSVYHGASRLASSKNAMKNAPPSVPVCQKSIATLQPVRLASSDFCQPSLLRANCSNFVKLNPSRDCTVLPASASAHRTVAAASLTGNCYNERLLCPLNVDQLKNDTEKTTGTHLEILSQGEHYSATFAGIRQCNKDVETKVDSRNDVDDVTSAELNDVMRQSDMLKSFQRVAPPRNSQSEKRSKLNKLSACEISNHVEIDQRKTSELEISSFQFS